MSLYVTQSCHDKRQNNISRVDSNCINQALYNKVVTNTQLISFFLSKFYYCQILILRLLFQNAFE